MVGPLFWSRPFHHPRRQRFPLHRPANLQPRTAARYRTTFMPPQHNRWATSGSGRCPSSAGPPADLFPGVGSPDALHFRHRQPLTAYPARRSGRFSPLTLQTPFLEMPAGTLALPAAWRECGRIALVRGGGEEGRNADRYRRHTIRDQMGPWTFPRSLTYLPPAGDFGFIRQRRFCTVRSLCIVAGMVEL